MQRTTFVTEGKKPSERDQASDRSPEGFRIREALTIEGNNAQAHSLFSEGRASDGALHQPVIDHGDDEPKKRG